LFRQQNEELQSELRLNHVLNSLTFGNLNSQLAIKNNFGENSEHTAFDMMEWVDDSLYNLDKSYKDYFYFLKLVPHVFVDEIKGMYYSAYSYSLNHNSKVRAY
jgi:hypothetical protein